MPSRSRFSKGLAGVTLSTAFVASSLWANGCTVIVNEATDYCSTDAECTAKGAQYANTVCRDSLCRQVQSPTSPTGADWSCVGKVNFSNQPVQQSATMTIKLIDPVSGTALPNMSVKPCGRIDTGCMSPITAPVLTDALGAARLPVPTVAATQGVPGFTGFFEILGEGRVPYLYFANPPVVADRETTFPISTPEQGQAFNAAVGFMPSFERGAVIVIAKDCKGRAAAGVRINIAEADADTRYFYTVGVAPSPDATETDPTGIVFVANVPAGTAAVSTYRVDTGAQTARFSLLTRPIFASVVEMEPTPL